MTRISALAAASAFLFLFAAGQAEALSVTNRDTTEHTLRITETGAQASRAVVIEPGQTLTDLCPTGCEVALSSGVSASFDGKENVNIQNGGFVLAE